MKKNPSMKKRLILLILIVVVYFAIRMLIASKEMAVTGYVPLANKLMEDSNYYLIVDKDDTQVSLKCSEEQYNQAIVDPELAYHISYLWNSLFPEKGKLVFFEPEDTIDNR
jgi:hypothetical protein